MEQSISKKQLLKKLFFSTLYLSTFTFGGGYVIVSLMKTKFVDELHWIDETEMLDLIAIAQSSPGAVAVNGAIVVGYKLCRIPGVFFSILGAIIPPFFIISIISGFYTLFQENEAVQALLSGMRSGVGAVIVSVVWDMGSGIVKQKKIAPILIMLCAFIANYYLKINIVLIILICIGSSKSHYHRTEEKSQMIYLQLFLSYLQIGAFSFGGGYAAMPLIQAQVVEKYHWLSMTEFGDLVTIAEMTPGPIAINSATFVGTQVAGLSGALIATLGCILPSCIIVTLLAKIYIQYRNVKIMQDILGTLRPVVVSMIAVAGLGILSSVFFLSGKFAPALSNFNIRGIIFFAGALLCLRKTKLSPILIMVGCGILELLYQTIF